MIPLNAPDDFSVLINFLSCIEKKIDNDAEIKPSNTANIVKNALAICGAYTSGRDKPFVYRNTNTPTHPIEGYSRSK